MNARSRHFVGQAASLALVLAIGVSARRAGVSLIVPAVFAWPLAYWSEESCPSVSEASRIGVASAWFCLALLASTSRYIAWHVDLAAVLLLALAIRFALVFMHCSRGA